MAVPIDNVYQKVLALCNKEQRGYVTPQEFNLFSDKAQNEIYENYFHQLNLAQRKPNSQKQHSDILESIEHKLSGFIESDLITVSTAAGGAALPSSVNPYRIIKVVGNNTASGKTAERVSASELDHILNNPLTAPSTSRSIYVHTGLSSGIAYLQFHPNGSDLIVSSAWRVFYYKDPTKPNWGYVLAGPSGFEKALYNAGTSTDFQLHQSEEENLVNKILILAGVTIQKQDIQQAGATQMQVKNQEQNS
jgi:hypothetical protein